MRVLACLVLVAGCMAASDSLVQVFNRAVSALAAGDYTAAEKGFREVLQSSPGHVGAMLNLGVTYSRLERFDDAIGMYQAVLKANPQEKSALANLAVAYVKKSSFADAMPAFRKLAEVNPESAVLHDRELMYRFAAGYLRLNRTEEARGAVEGLMAGNTRSFVLCKVDFEGGRFEEAATECRAAGAHRELGKVLVSQHSPEAAGELQQAIRGEPDDAEGQYYLGVALMQDGRTPDAVPHLERAMQLNAGFWGTYFYLGRARLELGKAEDAAALLRKAAGLNPQAAVVFYELGRALIASGHADEGREAMQRVKELRAQELEADAQALRKR